jgi:hypothetical protein
VCDHENFVDEEAIARARMQSQRERKKQIYYEYKNPANGPYPVPDKSSSLIPILLLYNLSIK